MRNLLGAGIALTVLCSAQVAAQPAISAVLDAGGYTADIAQGSVFVVKGTNLSAAGFVAAPAPTYPTTLNNVSIAFVSGGQNVAARMVYTFNQNGVNQLAAVLPSTTQLGDYDVRVTNAGAQSAAVRVKVVARKPGIVTANGGGTGPAQATIGGGLVLQRFVDAGKIGDFDSRPAKPGDRIDLWGTGLGPDTASDTGGSSGDLTASAQIRVIVGGVEVTPAYAGRSSGFPGLDQIAFFLPANVTTSCYVPVQVRAAGGVLSNSVSIAIAPANATACSHPTLSQDALRRLSLGQTSAIGAFVVASLGTEITVPGLPISIPPSFAETIGGAFSSYTQDLISGADFSAITGGCSVYRMTGTVTDLTVGVTPSPLDAGPQLTATKPDNANVTLTKTGNTHVYNANIGTFNGQAKTLQAGTYRLQGPGGTQVGPFTATVNVPAFDWTNRAAVTAVNRSQALTVNWTGGAPGWVEVTGYAGKAVSGSIQNPETLIIEAAVFACIAPGTAGTITVPASILQQLPAANFNPLGGGANFEIGSLAVLAVSDGQNGKFTAPLVPSGQTDYALFGYSVGYLKTLSYQ